LRNKIVRRDCSLYFQGIKRRLQQVLIFD